MIQRVSRLISLAVAILVVTLSSGAVAENPKLPQYSAEKHLGVATCASGVCHGSVRTRTSGSVRQNEYVIWSRRDRHRIAYNTLLGDESKKIARNLGLKNAHESDMCLDCHADNVASSKRGDRFQIDDGIGCEGCHGGAENYISSHVDPDTNRQENLDGGLYPTDNAHARAKLCLSCHLGTGKKMASHDIMGAGHPRISFELDTFSVLQPAHYVMDDDYKENKWSGSSVELWSIGQVEGARQTLALIRDRLKGSGLFPELALFDCHSCHHSMSDQKWAASDRASLPPGSVRLNDANFLMLFAIARVVEPGLEKRLKKGLKALHQTVANGRGTNDRISRLMSLLSEIDRKLAAGDLNNMTRKLTSAVVELAASGQLRDYVSAEQAVMAVDMLLGASNQRTKYASWLDSVYNTLQDEDNFKPANFARVMKKYGG